MKFAIYPNGKTWNWDDMEADGRFPGMASDDYMVFETKDCDWQILKSFSDDQRAMIVASIVDWLTDLDDDQAVTFMVAASKEA